VKVAVSIPDAVFEAAEDLAARRRCSRSSLYAQALERLLAEADADEVTARLDVVYEDEPSGLDPAMRGAQARALAEPW
jgi:metal-responsive CopG/Arc/MetJ family transcriptional regulator